MKKEIRKCLFCGKDFDINSVPFRKVGRRFIEEDCFAEYEKVQGMQKVAREAEISQYHEIFDFVRDHFSNPNYALVQKQIQEYIAKGMKYESIYKTLVWYYDISGNPAMGNGGIGIVPLVFEQAKTYYKRVWELEKQAKDRQLKIEVEEVHIKPPERNPWRKKQFTFLDEVEGE